MRESRESSPSGHVSRRAVLQGMGVTLTLPWLESIARAGQASAIASSAAGAGLPPIRMAFIFTPNGVNYDAWAPSVDGTNYLLSDTLQSLEPVREHLNVFSGLTLDKARANGDGPGDHARSAATFLTGRQARKTHGNDIHLGVSVDQAAAQQIGHLTRLPSLEIGCESGRRAGNCDSGYSCAYSSNISWRDENTPVPRTIDPRIAFERMFGGDAEAQAKERLVRRRSILDYVLDDSRRLERRLGTSDRQKLQEFQTAVREVERRIQFAQDEARHDRTDVGEMPQGVPAQLGEHIDLMYDMLLLAFRTDVTRIGTLMLGVEGTNQTIPEIGVPEGHHHLSHHKGDEHMILQIRRIDRFYTERFAGFVRRMADTPEGEGSLLDNCMILHGSGISDGNRHNHEDLPIILAGRGGGTIDTGRFMQSPRETPLCNLYVSMLDRMGCGGMQFGDSTGRLAGLRSS